MKTNTHFLVFYMKTNKLFLLYLAQFFLAWEIVHTLLCSVTFLNRAVCELMWKNVQRDSPQMTLWRMCIACWIHTHTNDEPKCPCNEGEQTVEHLIHVCSILEPQRSYMIKSITTRGGIWPPLYNELVAKYLNDFSKFVNFVDFSKL
jgi:hypothetical protein